MILDWIAEVIELDPVDFVWLPVEVVRGRKLVALYDSDVELDGILGSAIGALKYDGFAVYYFRNSGCAKL